MIDIDEDGWPVGGPPWNRQLVPVESLCPRPYRCDEAQTCLGHCTRKAKALLRQAAKKGDAPCS
jgi:hypothetical protein